MRSPVTTRRQVWTHILLLSTISIVLGVMGAVTWRKHRAEQEEKARSQATRELDEWLTGQVLVAGSSSTVWGGSIVWEPVEWPHTIDLKGYVGPAGATLALGDDVIAFVSSQGVVTVPDSEERHRANVDGAAAALLGEKGE